MTRLDWAVVIAVLAVACIPVMEWTRGRGKGWERVGTAAGWFHLAVFTFPISLLVLGGGLAVLAVYFFL